MVTDDERRRVAAELREMSDWDDEVDCTDFGKRVVNLLWRVRGCDGTEGAFYAALADLIEPTPTSSDTAPTCDREALLALAEEMEEFGNLPVKHPGIRVLHNDDFSRELGYARRIREACGATADE